MSQTCCSGGIPLSNNLGLPNLAKGSFIVGLNYDYNHLNQLNTGSENINDDSRLRITHSVLLNFSYAFTDAFSVEGLLTWVNQRRKISQFGNENLDQTSGIGDGVVLAKYNFRNGIGLNSDLILGLGTKIPLGSSTETNEQGIVYNADLQPGSNAWDVIYWLATNKSFDFRPSMNFSLRGAFRATGVNDSYFNTTSYEFGDELQLHLGAADQFTMGNVLGNPSLFFLYRNAGQDKIGGFDLPNTGGEWVFIVPSFGVTFGGNTTALVKANLPLYSNVEGTQLTPSYRLTAGVVVTLAPKQKVFN